MRSTHKALAAAVLWGLGWLSGHAPALAQGDPDMAERRLLERLADDPQDAMARLALGRLYLEARRDRAAVFQLRQALAGDLSAQAAQEARGLLEALERRRRWFATGDVFFVGDEEDRGFGGIGVGSLEHRVLLGEDLRLSVRGVGRAAVFEDSAENTVDLTVLAGPLWLGRGDNVTTVRALVGRRWLDGAIDVDSVGLQAEISRTFDDRVRTFTSLTARELDYANRDDLDGQLYSAFTDLIRFGRGGRFERANVSLSRFEARDEFQRYWFAQLGVGAYREVRYGFGLYAEPFVNWQDFDGLDPTDNAAREDLGLGVRARITKRDWRVASAAPFVQATTRTVNSTLSRFDRDETSVEFGFTRTF